jgi:type IV secretory pathway component VirB8
MKGLIISFLFLHFFYACSNEVITTASESDADAARNFIESALKGDYDKARNYMIQDSVNNQFLDAFERNYKHRMNSDDKAGYKNSSINIHSIRSVNDSNTVVNYSNSYKKQSDSLKIVRISGTWLVDLKYSFSITDTLP